MHKIFDGTRPFDQNILFLTRGPQEKTEEQMGRINARSVYKLDKIFEISFISSSGTVIWLKAYGCDIGIAY